MTLNFYISFFLLSNQQSVILQQTSLIYHLTHEIIVVDHISHQKNVNKSTNNLFQAPQNWKRQHTQKKILFQVAINNFFTKHYSFSYKPVNRQSLISNKFCFFTLRLRPHYEMQTDFVQWQVIFLSIIKLLYFCLCQASLIYN